MRAVAALDGRLARIEALLARGRADLDPFERDLIVALADAYGPDVSFTAAAVIGSTRPAVREAVRAIADTAAEIACVLRRAEGRRIGAVVVARAGRRTRDGQPWCFAPAAGDGT
jgi:hypothetical protein